MTMTLAQGRGSALTRDEMRFVSDVLGRFADLKVAPEGVAGLDAEVIRAGIAAADEVVFEWTERGARFRDSVLRKLGAL